MNVRLDLKKLEQNFIPTQNMALGTCQRLIPIEQEADISVNRLIRYTYMGYFDCNTWWLRRFFWSHCFIGGLLMPHDMSCTAVWFYLLVSCSTRTT